MAIPKKIHQIWIGPKKRPDRWMNTWKNLNPDWEYFFWGEEEIKNLGLKNQKQYEEIEEYAGKADIARYEILKEHGGFFCDADSECIQPLGDYFLDHEAFACWENETVRRGLIANGYIGVKKNSPIMSNLIDEISKKEVSQKSTGMMAWQNVGPLFFTQTLMRFQHKIAVYPSWTFIPEHYSGQSINLTDPNIASQIFAKQHWGSTKELSNPNYYNTVK